jgi:hypothetical protein
MILGYDTLNSNYTHATSSCAFQSLWGASIQGAAMTECRPPFKWLQRRSGVPQRFRPGGFKAVYAALAIISLVPLSFKYRAPTNSRLA